MNVGPGTQERLHHVGFVVASIEDAVTSFEKTVGLAWQARIFDDPLQRVRVTFLGDAGAPQLELVQPDGPDSPVRTFLSRGGGLHHLCYETEDLDARLAAQRSSGSIVVRSPVPAVAFEGRRIAWIYTRQKLLIEYLERRHAEP